MIGVFDFYIAFVIIILWNELDFTGGFEKSALFFGGNMELRDSISSIKNVGTQRQRLLNSMGIFTVENLLEHFPRDYDDRSNVRDISDIVENEENTFIGTVRDVVENVYVRKMCISKTVVEDDSGKITLVWYNQKFIKNVIKKDMTFMFTGKCQKKGGRKEIVSPEYESVEKHELLNTGRITPVYSVTTGMSQKVLRSLIKDTLDKMKNGFADFMPKSVRIENKLCERNFAVSNIHFPESDESFFQARRRLVFEELFVLQTALFRIKKGGESDKNGIVMAKKRYLADAKKLLGFEMTSAQKRTVDEICFDMASGKIMNRLVQGDVGSGKTACALCAAYVTIKNGYQCVLMAPTEVLAKQHYEYFKGIFEKNGINVSFLSGSLKKKEKDAAYEAIENGTAQMIVGTHAVIQKNVVFKNAGLVITDEQHRFGVNQRVMLSQKGTDPHVLVMTATPIPRTLALILYGDLDISVIDELPPGRQKIDTLVVNSSYHKRIYDFIRKEIADGGQVYIVCPMIEENEEIKVKDVEGYSAELENEFGSENVAVLHGKMKNDEKQAVMDEFSSGRKKILVATTVIEVGVNVPNASIMLIENAERFGLSQLHQLRGRVGRGSRKSWCILVSDSKSAVTKERLLTMKRTNDGFEISETDLKLRGPGEFFGTKQHGIPELKIANLYRDTEILKEAQKASKKLLEEDSELSKEENRLLKEKVCGFFDGEKVSI